MSQLKLYLFGSFQLVRNEQPVTAFRSDKARALLAYLVLEGRRPIARQTLYPLLWDGYTPEAAQASLRTTLSNLRKLLQPEAQIQATYQTVQFIPTPAFWCDATISDAENGTAADRLFEQLRHFTRGSFLLDFERIDSQPFHHWRQTQQARFQAQVRQIEAAHQSNRSQRAPTHQPGPHALPRPLTPLIGRTAEMQDVVAKVLDPEYPLVLLVGEGGVGKTRLALAVANTLQRDVAAQFPDGIGFVTLVGMTPGAEPVAQLAEAISQALQLPLTAEQALPQQLITHLRSKRLLLILDNLEGWHSCGAFLLAVIQQAPQVKLLLTSRQRLQIQAEYPIRVTGLPIPPAPLLTQGAREEGWADNPVTDEELALLLTYASVQLFGERARRAQSTFQITNRNGRLAAQICQLVAGLPLAIELAATLVRSFTCRQIRDTLTHEYTILATDLVDLPAQHRSLHTVFQQSWQMLTPCYQWLFAQLAVFAGTFDRAAVQAVTQEAHLLPELVDYYSLVAQLDEDRYALHSLLQQFAAAKLAAYPAATTVAARHSRYYLATARSLLPYYYSAEPDKLWHWLQRAEENLRVAWRFAIDHLQADLLREGTQVISLAYIHNKRYQEGISAFQQAIAGARQRLADPTAERAIWQPLFCELCGEVGRHQSYIGQVTEAVTLLQEAIAGAQGLSDPLLLARLYLYLGRCYVWHNHPATRQVLQHALDLAQQAGADEVVLRVREQMVIDFLKAHAFAEAIAACQENLLLARQLHLYEVEISTLNNLGAAEIIRLNYEGARRHLEASLTLVRSFQMGLGQWILRSNLALIALNQSRYIDMQQIVEALAADLQHASQPVVAVSLQHIRAEYRMRLGHFAQAAALIDQVEAWWVTSHYYGAAVHLAFAWLTQSRLYYRWGDVAKSYEYAQRILQLLVEQQTLIWRASTLVRLGYAALRQQRYAEAADAFAKANHQQQTIYPNELCHEAQIGAAYSRLLLGEGVNVAQVLHDWAAWVESQSSFAACEEPVEMVQMLVAMLQQIDATEAAQRVAACGMTWLQQRAANLPDDKSRQAYLKNTVLS